MPTLFLILKFSLNFARWKKRRKSQNLHPTFKTCAKTQSGLGNSQFLKKVFVAKKYETHDCIPLWESFTDNSLAFANTSVVVLAGDPTTGPPPSLPDLPGPALPCPILLCPASHPPKSAPAASAVDYSAIANSTVHCKQVKKRFPPGFHRPTLTHHVACDESVHTRLRKDENSLLAKSDWRVEYRSMYWSS